MYVYNSWATRQHYITDRKTCSLLRVCGPYAQLLDKNHNEIKCILTEDIRYVSECPHDKGTPGLEVTYVIWDTNYGPRPNKDVRF